MAEIDLNDKFPDLEPINKPPSLWTGNGIGLTVYGARDHDQETKTYIKTHCFIFLFVPILALGAYRVAKAGHDRWYFLGREPLSILAKLWNMVVVLGISGGISFAVWTSYYNSPNAIADRQLAKAETLLDDGKIVEAAKLYRTVLYGDSDRVQEGRDQLAKLNEHPKVIAGDLKQVAEVFAIQLATRRETAGDPIGRGVFKSAMSIVAERGDSDAASANQLLQTVKQVASDVDEYNQARRPILEQLVSANPNDVKLVSQFAETLEALGEVEQCEAILTPHAEKLAATEGARILGQIWAGAGKVDEAHGLLLTYCETRLAGLNDAESRLQRLIENEQQRIIRELELGRGPPEFYAEYDRSDDAAKITLAQEYLNQQMEDNQAIDEARNNYVAQTHVVPVALDLGMVQLQRAQAMTDKERQRQELEAAETTFKSIKNVAGESDQYRLYMGQVSYWLGKYAEGRQLFDDLLDANNRSFEILMGVSGFVREVGREAEARKLVEEAYENATKESEKHLAAETRGSMMADNEDRIKWLERANQQSPQVKAAYKSAQGSRAFQQGEFDLAASLYRESVAAYDELPESTSVLNNSGLTMFDLYRVTSSPDDFAEGLRRIEKAIALAPADSIVRYNASQVLLEAIYGDVIGDQLDLNLLKINASSDAIRYLYVNNQQKEQFIDKLRAHDGMQRVKSLLENVVLLAPKNANAHAQLASIHYFDRNLDGLKKVLKGVVAAQPEIDKDQVLAFHAGEEDDTDREQQQRRIQRLESVLSKTEPGTATHACGLGFLVINQLTAHYVIPVSNLDQHIQAGEAAWKQSPSSGSRATLWSLYLARAHQALKKENAEYSAFAAKCPRNLPPHYVIAVVAAEGGTLADQVVATADFKRALELTKSMLADFPGRFDSWEWALFRHADPALAKEIAEVVKQNELELVLRQIYRQISPASPTNALHLYWRKLSQGEPDAKSELKVCTDLGVPLPFDP